MDAASDWRRTDRPMNASERRLFALLKRLGTRIVPQAAVGPWTVDFLLPDVRVAVESDSRRYHAASEDARRDRRRDADLRARGYVVVHVWSEDLYGRARPQKVLRHVRLRVYRTRRVRLGGPGARLQFARLAGRPSGTNTTLNRDYARVRPRHGGTTMVDAIRVKKDDLSTFCVSVFEKLGVPKRDAEIATEVLVIADLRDKGSHGVARLPRYVDGLKKGIILPTDKSKVVHETPTTALIDGGSSLGQVVGHKGMAMAASKAKKSGTGFVTVRNSNHYGIAGYYALMAVPEGCIGISMTNAAPLVVPTFGRDALLGTNPIAIAVPAEGDPFLFDAATSVVPRGKLEVYDRQGKDMPMGWAVDSRGKGSTDAKGVLASLAKHTGGGILPLGGEGEEFSGHKGYGLAMTVEVLSSVLAGGAFGLATFAEGASANIAHFFGAMRVDAFRPLPEVKKDLRRFMDEVRNSPKAEGHDRIYTHGEKGFAAERDRLKNGIPLGPKVLDSLKATGEALGVPWKG